MYVLHARVKYKYKLGEKVAGGWRKEKEETVGKEGNQKIYTFTYKIGINRKGFAADQEQESSPTSLCYYTSKRVQKYFKI